MKEKRVKNSKKEFKQAEVPRDATYFFAKVRDNGRYSPKEQERVKRSGKRKGVKLSKKEWVRVTVKGLTLTITQLLFALFRSFSLFSTTLL